MSRRMAKRWGELSEGEGNVISRNGILTDGAVIAGATPRPRRRARALMFGHPPRRPLSRPAFDGPELYGARASPTARPHAAGARARHRVPDAVRRLVCEGAADRATAQWAR